MEGVVVKLKALESPHVDPSPTPLLPAAEPKTILVRVSV